MLINFLETQVQFCNSCAGSDGIVIPYQVVRIIHIIYNTIRWAVPAILIFIGMLDMAKAVTAQKEDDIKKAQSLLVKKAIAAALVFFIASIVLWIFGIINPNDGGVISCINSLLNGDC